MIRGLVTALALHGSFRGTNDRRLERHRFFDACPEKTGEIKKCSKDASEVYMIGSPSDFSANCTDEVNHLIDGKGNHSLLYNGNIKGIGIDPNPGSVKIPFNDLLDLLEQNQEESFVLFLTGAKEISLVNGQDLIARSVISKGAENLRLNITGEAVNLGNQWPITATATHFGRM